MSMSSGVPGVRIRGASILLDFTYRGERCRETLNIKPTKSALQEASRMREAIKFAIAMGNFDYADFFPDSPRALKLSRKRGRLITIEAALKEWLKKSELRCQYSTLKGYGSVIYHHLIPAFGHLSLSDLAPADVEKWISELGVSNKRVNNILGPLRQIYKDAFFEGVIDKNPLERVRFLPVNQREPKPFTSEEIDRILSKLEGQSRNLVKFAFWSGLRTSELIALRWEDIDLDNDRFYVRVAVVNGREKSTKTVSGLRHVPFNDHTLSVVLDQKRHSSGGQRVFIDPKTGKPWSSDQVIRKRVWIPALKSAGVEYRNPYQTRHTFASMMLMEGKHPMWVAQQMGHKDWGMIRTVYGRWITQEGG